MQSNESISSAGGIWPGVPPGSATALLMLPFLVGACLAQDRFAALDRASCRGFCSVDHAGAVPSIMPAVLGQHLDLVARDSRGDFVATVNASDLHSGADGICGPVLGTLTWGRGEITQVPLKFAANRKEMAGHENHQRHETSKRPFV